MGSRFLLLVAAVALLITSAPQAIHAQDPAAAGRACWQDIGQYCTGVLPGGGRIVQCLMAHGPELSPGCVSALKAAEAARQSGQTETPPSTQGNLFDRLRAFRQMREQDRTFGQSDYHLSLEHDGIARQYNVHLPPSYHPNVPMPVVIYLHGAGGNIAAAYRDKMDQESDKLGFILVIPAGTGRLSDIFLVWNVGRWDDQACCGYAYEHQIDDVGFISEVIDTVKAEFAVDARRIYATGISNGGLLSYLLGCKLPNKVAAVAPVAPPGIPDGCSSSGPVSILHVHGTDDLFAKYNGGEGGSVPYLPGACIKLNQGGARAPCVVQPTEQQIDYWVKKDQCSRNPLTVYRNGAVTCMLYSPCADGSEIEFCKIEGGGHTWPSGSQYMPVSRVGPVSFDISFDQMWDFLKRHTIKK